MFDALLLTRLSLILGGFRLFCCALSMEFEVPERVS